MQYVSLYLFVPVMQVVICITSEEVRSDHTTPEPHLSPHQFLLQFGSPVILSRLTRGRCCITFSSSHKPHCKTQSVLRSSRWIQKLFFRSLTAVWTHREPSADTKHNPTCSGFCLSLLVEWNIHLCALMLFSPSFIQRCTQTETDCPPGDKLLLITSTWFIYLPSPQQEPDVHNFWQDRCFSQLRQIKI